MKLAASGRPDKMLTLTCAPLAEPNADKARALLHKAWRTLRLTIARQLELPSSRRWQATRKMARSRATPLEGPAGTPAPRKAPAALPYFAVVERHRSGRPHLHILLRCDYIPQRWISDQMRRLAASPICDIRAVHGTKQAAAYVAKYIGKAPAKFGNSRAYWYTKNWCPAEDAEHQAEVKQVGMFSVSRRDWEETRQEVYKFRPLIDLTTDGWFSVSPRAAPFGAMIVRGRYPPLFKTGPPDVQA